MKKWGLRFLWLAVALIVGVWVYNFCQKIFSYNRYGCDGSCGRVDIRCGDDYYDGGHFFSPSPSFSPSASSERASFDVVAAPIPDSNEFEAPSENAFCDPSNPNERFSTFGLDVDSASYSVLRRFLERERRLPPSDAVRVEEMLNYFDYDLAQPADDADSTFATSVEIGRCPWREGALLAKIGVQARDVPFDKLPPLNLVFLIDVSGSMNADDKLPLVQRALGELTERLRPQDSVAIVVYAGDARVALKSTKADAKAKIRAVVDELTANGSTFGSGGIELAYREAKENFDPEAINRVVLCSDGDFNVGTTDGGDLEDLVARGAKSGVFLTVLGFGMGNYKDSRMELLADRGDGNYGYADGIEEARRFLVDELPATLIPIAKDVKIQVDFNPANVAQYRLLGYENRALKAEEFDDDKKDAGEIGVGANVVALYEIVPQGAPRVEKPEVASRYAAAKKDDAEEKTAENDGEKSSEFDGELMFVKIRYKNPDGEKSRLESFPVAVPTSETLAAADDSSNFRFTAAVALFAQILRKSEFTENSTLAEVGEMLKGTTGADEKRAEFARLVDAAKRLQSDGFDSESSERFDDEE